MHQSLRDSCSFSNAICPTLQEMDLVSLVQITTSSNNYSSFFVFFLGGGAGGGLLYSIKKNHDDHSLMKGF